jgi:hypothetical protein
MLFSIAHEIWLRRESAGCLGKKGTWTAAVKLNLIVKAVHECNLTVDCAAGIGDISKSVA